MSKKQGVKRTKQSQVDYHTRIQIEKAATIAVEREAAAKQALKIACVALNESEGLGFTRLCRFALTMQGIISDLNADPERTMYHIDNRLRKMGFPIDGVSISAPQGEDGQFYKLKDLPEEDQLVLELQT